MFRLVERVKYPHLHVLKEVYQHQESDIRINIFKPTNLKDARFFTFTVTFLTTPPNKQGYPHIIEHSVLHGNKVYQSAGDLFFELYYRSFATELNASTMHNSTHYYASTSSFTDLLNLFEVYLASLFKPILAREILAHEGFYWHWDRASQDFIPKGVIFNEMQQGVYSLGRASFKTYIETMYPRHLHKRLFEFGGSPLAMLKGLMFEELIDFYRVFYRPDNAVFSFWGPISYKAVKHIFDRVESILGDILQQEYLRQGNLQQSNDFDSLNVINVEIQRHKTPKVRYFEPSYNGERGRVQFVMVLPFEPKTLAVLEILDELIRNSCSSRQGSLREAEYYSDLRLSYYYIDEKLYVTLQLLDVDPKHFKKAVDEFLSLVNKFCVRVSQSQVDLARRRVLIHDLFGRDKNDAVDNDTLITFNILLKVRGTDFLNRLDRTLSVLRKQVSKQSVVEFLKLLESQKFNRVVFYAPKPGVTEHFNQRLKNAVSVEKEKLKSNPRMLQLYKELTASIEKTADKSGRDQTDDRKPLPVLNVRNEEYPIPSNYVKRIKEDYYWVLSFNRDLRAVNLEFDLEPLIAHTGEKNTWLLLILSSLLFRGEFYAPSLKQYICKLRVYVPSFRVFVTSRRLANGRARLVLVVRFVYHKRMHSQVWRILAENFFDLVLKPDPKLYNIIVSILGRIQSQTEDSIFRISLYEALRLSSSAEEYAYAKYFGLFKLAEFRSLYTELLDSKTKKQVFGNLVDQLKEMTTLLRNLPVASIFLATDKESELIQADEFYRGRSGVGGGLLVSKEQVPSVRGVIGLYATSNVYIRGLLDRQQVITPKKNAQLLLIHHILDQSRVLPFFRFQLTAYGGGIRWDFEERLVSIYGYRLSSLDVRQGDIARLFRPVGVSQAELDRMLPSVLRELLVKDTILDRLRLAVRMYWNNLWFDTPHKIWDRLRKIRAADIYKVPLSYDHHDIHWGVLTSHTRKDEAEKWIRSEMGIDNYMLIDFSSGQIQTP